MNRNQAKNAKYSNESPACTFMKSVKKSKKKVSNWNLRNNSSFLHTYKQQMHPKTEFWYKSTLSNAYKWVLLEVLVKLSYNIVWKQVMENNIITNTEISSSWA
jgi:hypothetical protein